ncbi:DUF4244 domain-containing protein [Actinoplanes sp. TFC3]|uniref:DUF4244 domain-containing protein n=1 Tax=Actinoplanes sp. TFC3 TaxID=1710355 RepID=UPI000A91FE0D|nr:DUF4244 domain-containing protein [Actinoplanes sp. TFC3]
MNRLLTRLAQANKDDGMSTIEYAMGSLAAAGLAAVLYKVVQSPIVQTELNDVIARAFG